MEPTIEAAKNAIHCMIDEKIFPRPVICAAAYIFIERCYIRLSRAEKKHVQVQLKGKKKLAKSQLEKLAGEFENELLHQLLRNQVAQKTDQLREIIVGRALLSAEPSASQEHAPLEQEEPVHPDSKEDLDYMDDPLGIAVPWEEKYGGGKDDKQ
jgi:His-Xaa-Ser system protein HxsD